MPRHGEHRRFGPSEPGQPKDDVGDLSSVYRLGQEFAPERAAALSSLIAANATLA